MSTALSTTKDLRQQLSGDYFKQQVAMALPRHMTPDRFVRVALTALLKTPKLMDCTPESVIQCMLNCSALGLEPDGRRAHLIPYGNVCTLIVDYKGIVELAKRSGDVSNVFAQIVCDADSFEWTNGEVKHQIDWKRDRGGMYAVYATITFKDGTKQTDVMTKSEVEAIRKRSKAGGSGPWVTDYNEMAKKTVFRRASKWVTLSPEVADVLEKEDQVFGSAGAVIDVPNEDGDLGPVKPTFTKRTKPKETVVEVAPEPKSPEPSRSPDLELEPEPDPEKPAAAPKAAPEPVKATGGQSPEIADLLAAMAEGEVSTEQILAFAAKKSALKEGTDKDLAVMDDIIPSKVPIMAKMIRQKGAAYKEIKG